jgi:hypothetical protein
MEMTAMSEATDRRRSSRTSDRDLLLSIGRDLRRLYADTLQQPLPKNMEALLVRIGHAELEKQLRKEQTNP